jgi:hypothetical protein
MKLRRTRTLGHGINMRAAASQLPQNCEWRVLRPELLHADTNMHRHNRNTHAHQEFPKEAYCDVRFDRIEPGQKKPPEKASFKYVVLCCFL